MSAVLCPCVELDHRVLEKEPVGGEGDRRPGQLAVGVERATILVALWAAGLALRSPAVGLMIADGSGFDMATTRRIQLVAKAHQTTAWLVRPPWETRELSAAQTRWLVRWEASPEQDDEESSAFNPGWSLELLRCKGMQPDSCPRVWALEWDRGEGAVRLSTAMAHQAGDVGEMVHPYLRRRNGEEPVHYPDETIRKVLGKTLGVPLFQEQVMALAIQAAGFTPGEAEKLRRAITAWTSKNDIAEFPARFVSGMMRNGYCREFAEWCFQRFKGFSQYGFPESHAASFALLVYASAWIKCYYPAVFAAALLNSQPLGFYAPAQIVRDAQEHGVTVRPVDVNHSQWDCALEEDGTVLRLGLRMADNLRRRDADCIVEAVRRFGTFPFIFDLWRASEVSPSSLRALAQADAFQSMGLDRQHSLWEVRKLNGKPLPLFDGLPEKEILVAQLPPVSASDVVTRDYCSVGLSLKAHPLSFLRSMLRARRVITAAEAKDENVSPFGRMVAVAGIVLFRQRPGTAKGVMFMTIEDETGRIDLIVRPDVYERFRDAAVYAKLVIARGRVERRDGVVHLLSLAFEDVERHSENLPRLSRDFR